MKAKYKQYHCPHCNDGRLSGRLESPSHLMECAAYSELRKGINPESVIQERPGYLRSYHERKERTGRTDRDINKFMSSIPPYM